MSGVFGLISPKDLLGKLGRDLDALRRSPDNCDLAFNFFVTAEHMLDWIYPGSANRKVREDARNGDVLLQLVSHIANGAKHFDQLSAHHRSIGAYVLRSWRLGVWRTGAWGTGTWSDGLTMVLAGDAAKAFGKRVKALELAERTYAYWSEPGRVK